MNDPGEIDYGGRKRSAEPIATESTDPTEHAQRLPGQIRDALQLECDWPASAVVSHIYISAEDDGRTGYVVWATEDGTCWQATYNSEGMFVVGMDAGNFAEYAHGIEHTAKTAVLLKLTKGDGIRKMLAAIDSGEYTDDELVEQLRILIEDDEPAAG